MLFIHIRSPCKILYQVSLNFNIQDSGSEELEVDQMHYENHKTLTKNSNEHCKNSSKKLILNRYLSTSPDSVVLLQEKSPKGLYNFSGSKQDSGVCSRENEKINSHESFGKVEIRKKDGSLNKEGNRTEDIKIRVETFKKKHENILNSECNSRISKKIDKRQKFVFGMREKMFGPVFVKKIIFTAWKGVCSKLL
jgi:hypothetical protein